MNSIMLSGRTCIQVESADHLTANTGFYHVNRVAPFHVLIYCIKGNIYVGEDEEELSVGPGELLLLKSGHHQWPTSMIREGTSWIYLHFYTAEPELARTDAENPIGRLPEIYLPQMTYGLHNSEIESRLFQLIDLIHSSEGAQKLLISSYLYEIFILLYENSRRTDQPDLADNIMHFLESASARALQTGDLEDEFHLTYKYMEHIFRNKTGISIMQYHTKVRIKEAARILRSTDLPISQVSEMCGFSDPLYFSRCFKKHMCISPRAYRLGKIAI